MSKRLEKEVWSLDNCAGCGLCVAACSKQVLAWEPDSQHPVIKQRTKTVGYTRQPLDSCSFCQKFCEEACPRLESWTPLEARVILSARARGPVRSGAPNDVARAILAAGRSAGLLDGVLMLDLDPWNLQPVAHVASTVEEIVDTVGPQYLWAPVFEALNEAVFVRKMEDLAVFSTPCAAQAVRKLRESSNPRLLPYQQALRLTVAVFCTGIYQSEMLDDLLLKQMGVARDQVKRVEVSPDREWLRVVLWDDSVRRVGRQVAERYTRPGCASCEDYLGESADLAVGALGVPEDASALLIRSRTGDVFVRNAVQMNLLETGHEADVDVLQAAAEQKDRRGRAREMKALEILMLDALADPLKRGEAIQQFVRLYRTPVRTGAEERSRNGCTGC